MSTNYSLSDQLPKDASGQKGLAWTNDQTSQLDYALIRGIAASQTGSKILAYLGVGTATQSSRVESLHPGVNLGATYLDYSTTAVSPVSSGRFKLLGATERGELYTTPFPSIPETMTTGSAQTMKSGLSGVLKSFGVSWSGVNLGDSVTVSNGAQFMYAIVFASAAGHADRIIPNGGVAFPASITVRRVGLTGQSSTIVTYV